jgi:hypothetical protein
MLLAAPVGIVRLSARLFFLFPSAVAYATPLPEAPARVHVHLERASRYVQLTLRDSDDERLLARLDAVLRVIAYYKTSGRKTCKAPSQPGHSRLTDDS